MSLRIKSVAPGWIHGVAFLLHVHALVWPGAVVAADEPTMHLPQPEASIAWVRDNAVPLRIGSMDAMDLGGADDGLRSLGEMIRPDTRVVGFGEAAHNHHEFLALRNRLFAYLVEHHGVTAYAGETSFTEAVRVDDYVTRGGAPARDVVASVYAYSPASSGSLGWDEDRQLIEWMRAYNLRPTTRRPIRFYGIDSCPQHSKKGRSTCMRPAIQAVLDYVGTVDPAAAAVFEGRLVPYLPVYEADLHSGKWAPQEAPAQASDPAQRDAFTAALVDLEILFADKHVRWVKETSPLAYHRAYRNVAVAQQLDANVRMNVQRPPSKDLDAIGKGENRFKSGRDWAMAANVLWALDREGPHGRIFLFEHNLHLDKGAEGLAGARLHEILGRQFLLIGSISPDAHAGAWYPSLSTLLATIDQPLFVLNLASMPLLETARQERGISWANWHITPQWRVQDSYDAMIYVRHITPARKLNEK